jgi:hypothetical protein
MNARVVRENSGALATGGYCGGGVRDSGGGSGCGGSGGDGEDGGGGGDGAAAATTGTASAGVGVTCGVVSFALDIPLFLRKFFFFSLF